MNRSYFDGWRLWTLQFLKNFRTTRSIGMEHASSSHGASWRYSIIGISWIATPSDKEGKK